jgi:hypothetical protein
MLSALHYSVAAKAFATDYVRAPFLSVSALSHRARSCLEDRKARKGIAARIDALSWTSVVGRWLGRTLSSGTPWCAP